MRKSIVLFLGGALLGSVVALTSQVTAYQLRMKNALASLQNAKQQLQAAERDKVGHRTKAVQLTQQAIYETQAGIQAGAR